MPEIYVRSTDGDDLDTGATWALAKATMLDAAASGAAGDTIYLSQLHSESQAAGMTITLAGTNSAPVKVLAVNDGAEPPTTLGSTALIETTGANSLFVHGAAYFYGVTFSAGSGFVNSNLVLNSYTLRPNCVQFYERCQFLVMSSGLGAGIKVNGAAAANAIDNATVWKDCDIKTGTPNGAPLTVFGRLTWNGGSVLAGSAASSGGLISSANSAGEGSFGIFAGLDLSNMGVSQPLFHSTVSTARFVISNSKLPAAWSGTLVGGTINVADRFEMHNCDSADTNYRLWVEDYAGSIKSETTIVRTGGASDGTTPFAWRMISSANAVYPLTTLDTPGLPARWNDTVGTPITITVEILHDSLTALKDDEVWLDVQFLGTSGVPLSLFESDAKANILATAAAQTTSTATWTTTGLTNPNKQQLSVTVTPQEAGFIQAKVHLAKAGYTVFVDPKLTVS